MLDIQDLSDNGNILNFTQQQADWNENNAASPAYIQNRPMLVTSYNQLEDKPTLFNGDYLSLTGTPNFAAVATTGMYGDLSGVPTNLSQFTNDSGFITGFGTSSSGAGEISFNGGVLYYTGPDLATVATSGNYNDLYNLPNLFDGSYLNLTDKPTLATVATSGLYSDLTGAPNLATVATTGSYNDLSNQPTIPTDISNLTDSTGLLPAAQIRYEMRSASFTAEIGKTYWLNSTSGALTVTLPANPTTGDWVVVYDAELQWQTNNLTISGNGNNVRIMSMGGPGGFAWNSPASSVTVNQAMYSPVGPLPLRIVWNGTVWSTAM